MESKRKKLRIAVVCRTIGLEYDDRIRKECTSLSKVADVKIFVTFENNIEEEGVTTYGVPYKSFSLSSRKKFKSGKFLLIKAFEFYFKVKKHLNDFDLLWAHEEYTFLFPLFAKRNKFIWDLHEIPELFDKPILKQVFHLIEKRSKTIIHANSYRINYQIDRQLIKHPSKHTFIRNLPDDTFVLSELNPPEYNDFTSWLKNAQYIYIQGVSSPDRYPYNSLSSILNSTFFKIVVVGSFNNKELKEKFDLEFGNSFKERVYFTGMINQLSTPVLIKNAVFSMVFYQTTTPNARYCEANRFYQQLAFSIPVITGNNEPLSDIITQFGCGISLDSDGSEIEDIMNAIRQLMSDYPYYKANAESVKTKFIWNDKFTNDLI